MKVYEKRDHLKRWSFYVQRCSEIESAAEREKVRSALQFLEKELGQDFLDYAYERHELYYYLVSEQWTYITWFAEALTELKTQNQNDNNYEIGLLRLLKHQKDFFSSVNVVEHAYKFLKAGFKIAFEPQILVRNREKTPDLKLIDNTSNRELFVESSTVGRSKPFGDMLSYSRIDSRLCIDKLKKNVDYSGRIYKHKPFEETKLDEIVNEVEKTIDKIKQGSLLQELVIKDNCGRKAVEIAVAPAAEKISLQKWASERGLIVGQITGPPLFNGEEAEREIRRTQRTIRKKLAQLSTDYPSGLIVQNSSLFWRPLGERVKSELNKTFDNNHHLLFLILTGKLLLDSNSATPNTPDYFIQPRADRFVDCSLVLINDHCKFKIERNTINKINNAFSYSWWFV